jgi:hypothetical protein
LDRSATTKQTARAVDAAVSPPRRLPPHHRPVGADTQRSTLRCASLSYVCSEVNSCLGAIETDHAGLQRQDWLMTGGPGQIQQPRRGAHHRPMENACRRPRNVDIPDFGRVGALVTRKQLTSAIGIMDICAPTGAYPRAPHEHHVFLTSAPSATSRQTSAWGGVPMAAPRQTSHRATTPHASLQHRRTLVCHRSGLWI